MSVSELKAGHAPRRGGEGRREQQGGRRRGEGSRLSRQGLWRFRALVLPLPEITGNPLWDLAPQAGWHSAGAPELVEQMEGTWSGYSGSTPLTPEGPVLLCAWQPVRRSSALTGGSMVKNPHATPGDSGSIPGSGRSPGGSHSSILAWEISWMEEPGGLQSRELQRVWMGLSIQHRWAQKIDTAPTPSRPPSG